MSDEEDEVKVHFTDDIEGGEAGEPSSGEEGEIKGMTPQRVAHTHVHCVVAGQILCIESRKYSFHVHTTEFIVLDRRVVS